jgi:hypothetical protein
MVRDFEGGRSGPILLTFALSAALLAFVVHALDIYAVLPLPSATV